MLNIVKLTAALKDSIPDQYILLLLDFIIIDEEKEWEVKQVLDSCWNCQQY